MEQNQEAADKDEKVRDENRGIRLLHMVVRVCVWLEMSGINKVTLKAGYRLLLTY